MPCFVNSIRLFWFHRCQRKEKYICWKAYSEMMIFIRYNCILPYKFWRFVYVFFFKQWFYLYNVYVCILCIGCKLEINLNWSGPATKKRKRYSKSFCRIRRYFSDNIVFTDILMSIIHTFPFFSTIS